MLALLFFNREVLFAQSIAAPALKAAFLYNFAKFTEWPSDALVPGQRLSLCVVGDDNVADALEQTIRGHAIEGHELTLTVAKPDAVILSCHLLYVSASDVKRAAPLLARAAHFPIFTVSDADRFAESGGIAQLILEDDRMRFAINVTSAKRSRLNLSSKLLNLAQVINGGLDGRR